MKLTFHSFRSGQDVAGISRRQQPLRYYAAEFAIFLLVGSLAMLLTEVFAGSFPLWFTNVNGWLIVFPLYLGHLLFFLNVALRIRKTSVSHLYFFGVLIALYESWITKVLWVGYPGSSGPIAGTFLGVASLEFSVLVFFWHPLFAFVLPLLMFEVLAVPTSPRSDFEKRVLPSHLPFLKRKVAVGIVLLIMAVIGAAFLTNNSNVSQNPAIAISSALGSTLIILLLYGVARTRPDAFSVELLRLSNGKLALVAAYLVFLYVFMSIFQHPEDIPDYPTPILAIISFYGLVALIIKVSPKDRPNPQVTVPNANRLFSARQLSVFFACFLLTTGIMCVIPEISGSLALIFNLLIFVTGPLVFTAMTLLLLRDRILRLFRKNKQPSDSQK
jgi:hypothetical protein